VISQRLSRSKCTQGGIRGAYCKQANIISITRHQPKRFSVTREWQRVRAAVHVSGKARPVRYRRENLQDGRFLPADEFLAAAKNPEIIHDLAPQARLSKVSFPRHVSLPRHRAANELAAQDDAEISRTEWSQITRQGPDKRTKRWTPVTFGNHPASLVERETPNARTALVCGLSSENRLRKGMPLAMRPR